MNLAIPVLICDPSEDFRSLLREMLGKNGFFHVLEASHAEDSVKLLKSESKAFLIIRSALMTQDLMQELKAKEEFLIIGQPEDDRTILLAGRFGVAHTMSFPFSSQVLGKRMSQFC